MSSSPSPSPLSPSPSPALAPAPSPSSTTTTTPAATAAAVAAAAGGAASLPQTLWRLRVPLHITHPSRPNSPFVGSLPRFGYLALLLPRLRAFFGPGAPCSGFHHEEVQLRNLPLGLLVDLHRPELPWRLVVGEGHEWHIGDTFLNGAKEADFVRNGNAKQIMGMSKEDTTALWNAVQDNDFPSFARINTRLLNAPTPLKHIPLRIYIPSPGAAPAPGPRSASPAGTATAGEYKVLQVLVPPRTTASAGVTASRIMSRSGAGSQQHQHQHPQTLGPALRSLLPALFPSSRDPVLASVVMHGAPVPFSAPLEDLMREAAYPDGWLCLIVVLL